MRRTAWTGQADVQFTKNKMKKPDVTNPLPNLTSYLYYKKYIAADLLLKLTCLLFIFFIYKICAYDAIKLQSKIKL